MKHATIIPLIGGLTIGNEQSFGQKPDYLVSYKAFKDNDSHLVNYYEKEVPYVVLDGDEPGPKPWYVDVVGSVCPCAGLSALSVSAHVDNPINDWLYTSSNYVLENIKPQVYWGENAPRLATPSGTKVRDQLYDIGRKNGYSLSVYRTKSLLHGLSQVRERSFFFFWKGDKTPLLGYFNRPHERIEETIAKAKGSNFQTEVTNESVPTKLPTYRYILEGINGGMSHPDFQKSLTGTMKSLHYIQEKDGGFRKAHEWLAAHGEKRVSDRMLRHQAKIDAGLGYMDHDIVVPNDYIGAFVSHMPQMCAHPSEDRFLNYRECMTIMGLPDNFELLNPKKSLNHVCQNVPVTTARDMADEIKAALEGKREWVNSTYTYQYNHTQKHNFHFEHEGSTLGDLM